MLAVPVYVIALALLAFAALVVACIWLVCDRAEVCADRDHWHRQAMQGHRTLNEVVNGFCGGNEN